MSSARGSSPPPDRTKKSLPASGSVPHFAVEVKALTEGRGVNVILDMVGAPYMVRNVRSLSLDGRLVMIAFLKGSKVQDFDFVHVLVRRLTITGSTLWPRTAIM
jgi:NADPH2:quinone reductase